MTWWRVSTTEKKNVEEHELWQQGDWVIRRINGYRWGTVLVETEDDDPPEFYQNYGPSGNAVNMYECDYEYELVSLDDGCYADVIWPDEMPEEERNRLEAIWDEDDYGGWVDEGWEQYETECWFSGPLEIVRDDTCEQEWHRAEITDELQDVFQEGLGNKEDSKTAWPFPQPDPRKDNK